MTYQNPGYRSAVAETRHKLGLITPAYHADHLIEEVGAAAISVATLAAVVDCADSFHPQVHCLFAAPTAARKEVKRLLLEEALRSGKDAPEITWTTEGKAQIPIVDGFEHYGYKIISVKVGEEISYG